MKNRNFFKTAKIKTYISILLCFLLFSCNNKEKKETNSSTSSTIESKKEESTNKKTDSKVVSLTQNGDYSLLLNRETNDCSFISAEKLSKALQVAETTIKSNGNECGYILLEENGNSTGFSFTVVPMKQKDIEKEIKSFQENMETFGEDSMMSHIQKSETGDTWLGMHQNRFVTIFNDNYKAAIYITYKPKINPAENDMELIRSQKEEARNRAYKIANYLLSNSNNS